ncbi:MAG: Hsp20/alpha crystallin family protein [Spirochaetaceae bacterium]|nr:MAG: Hsp20/alpha crystallin family protein [Spirochaetaceae bacterium]
MTHSERVILTLYLFYPFPSFFGHPGGASRRCRARRESYVNHFREIIYGSHSEICHAWHGSCLYVDKEMWNGGVDREAPVRASASAGKQNRIETYGRYEMNYLTVRRPAVANSGLSTLGSFDRLFDSVFSGVPGWDTRKPAVDIRADEQQYTIEADLPGMSEDQFDVRIEDNLLVISSLDKEKSAGSDKGVNNGEEHNGYLLRERRCGAFHRSFSLPKDADAGKIDATYRNGVLSVVLPKKPESKPRQIKINRG